MPSVWQYGKLLKGLKDDENSWISAKILHDKSMKFTTCGAVAEANVVTAINAFTGMAFFREPWAGNLLANRDYI